MAGRLLVAVGIAAVCLAAAGIAAGHGDATCDPSSTERTDVLIDGDLYAYVEQGGRYDFGWSDVPVLSFPEAVGLIRELGLRGTAQQLLSVPELRGSDFSDEGSYSVFSVRCPGAYSARFVTREAGFARFWLQQSRFDVERSYCMPALLLPKGAWVTTRFTSPLGRTPPSYTVDRNRDGVVDRRGTFRSGGKNFPVSTRC
jgi:hypothetical protein